MGIFIKGAKSNNLKDVSLFLPREKLIVVTGVSGSGKSSITMDTLFAEGQRRYVESLSSYARQFLMRMKKPEVDYIKGLCPAIAIEQKVGTTNARSTVGTLTEIYDFLRILFARIGKTISPISGKQVKKHRVRDVVEFLKKQKEGAKVQLFIPFPTKYGDRTLEQELNLMLQKGYTRVQYKKEIIRMEDILEGKPKLALKKKIKDIDYVLPKILIDRFVIKKDDEENWKRIADSIQTCFFESEGDCLVDVMDKKEVAYNNRFELDGMLFIEPSPHLFNYNNPFGACRRCEGFGRVMGIDENKVVPDFTKSVYEGAIACWRGEKAGKWLEAFLDVAYKFKYPVHKPYAQLCKAHRRLLWKGNQYFDGIDAFFERLEEKKYKIQNRVMLSR
ncbi:MAG: excinuclease ABC subunit A, partial [Saprospiraceae bacterium]|nr:excinuclease ABC subunit A [Saprospiraceae bacterium]